MSLPLSPLVLHADEGERLPLSPPSTGHAIIKIDRRSAGETRFAMGTLAIEPGGAVPLHLHESCEEVVFVYSGRGAGTLGEADIEMIPGTTLYIPRGAWHGIREVVGVEPLRLTWIACPAGLEEFLRQLSAQTMTFSGALSSDALARLAEAHGVRFKPPEP
jgi:mannose-6-phosphate isomerase-like protein (cupin superfamily)